MAHGAMIGGGAVSALWRVARGGVATGGQLHVLLNGEVVIDEAIGEARVGTPMRRDSLMAWFSVSKIALAIASAIAWERRLFDLDDPVSAHVPEFGTQGKERITIRHLLTHTAGIRDADGYTRRQPFERSWDEIIALISAAPIEADWIPGRRAGYHPTSTSFMVGEVIRRTDGRPFEQFVRDEVFAPLGMDESWIGMPPATHAKVEKRLAITYWRADGDVQPFRRWHEPEAVARCIPASTGRGTMRDAARMVALLVGRGIFQGTRLLSPQVVDALVARQRVGLYDETEEVLVDWGLGVAIDADEFGVHRSPRSFGHTGLRSVVAFGDPECGLAAAYSWNGLPDEDPTKLMEQVSSAIYEDVGLT